MTISTNLNDKKLRTFPQSPYFDDFNESKNFYRILFKPSYVVQTRELNQLQTILQDQIGKIGNTLFNNKQAVTGGQIQYNKSIPYIKLHGDTTLIHDLIDYQNATIKNADGLTATIQFVLPKTDEDNPITVYLKYENANPITGETVFKSNENLTVTVNNNSEIVKSSGIATYSGYGSAIVLEEGIFYIKQTFVFVPKQVLMVTKYQNELDFDETKVYSVAGLHVIESIVTAYDDESLLDNAMGSPNEYAVGADRYKIECVLVDKSQVPEEELINFTQLIKIENNEVAQKPREENDFLPSIMQLLARRTYDQAGDFVVDYFQLELKEHLLKYLDGKNVTSGKLTINNAQTNGGVYTLDNGGDETKLVASLDAGCAYVKGWEVRTQNTTRLEIPKARDTITINNDVIQLSYNTYLTVGVVDSSASLGTLNVGMLLNLVNKQGGKIGSCYLLNVQVVDENQLKLFITRPKFDNVGYSLITVNQVTSDSTSSVQFNSKLINYNMVANDSLIVQLNAGVAKSITPNITYFEKQITGKNSGNRLTLINTVTSHMFSSSTEQYYIAIKNGKSGKPASIVSANGNRVVLDISNLITGSSEYEYTVITDIINNDSTFKTKTIVGADGSYIENHTITNSTLKNTIQLKRSDGIKLISVKSSTGEDLTSLFTFNGGQQDTLYSNSTITYTGTNILLNKQLVISYSYFSHSTTGSFFCSGSYLGMKLEEIPSYGDVRLCNVIDFRPRVDNGKLQLNVESTDVTNGLSSINQQFICRSEYYLPRMDRIVATASGNLVAVHGVPALTPMLPDEVENSITLYTLYIKPYTFNVNDVSYTQLKYKRYTMNDIGILDNRISTVEEEVLLSKLEMDTANMNFDDSFKSGFIVDNFSSSFTADIDNDDYCVAIDMIDNICRPAVITQDVDLLPIGHKFVGQDWLPNNVAYHKNTGIITLPYRETMAIEQPLCSGVIRVQPLLIHGYGEGIMTITPNDDVWNEDYSVTEVNNLGTTTNNVDKLISQTATKQMTPDEISTVATDVLDNITDEDEKLRVANALLQKGAIKSVGAGGTITEKTANSAISGGTQTQSNNTKQIEVLANDVGVTLNNSNATTARTSSIARTFATF